MFCASAPFFGLTAYDIEVGRRRRWRRVWIFEVLQIFSRHARFEVVLRCRLLQPSERLGAILGYAQSFGVHTADGVLADAIAQFGQFARPGQCLGIVASVRGKTDQLEHRAHVALLGRLAEPRDRLGVVSRQAKVTEFVEFSECALCIHVALIGCLFKPRQADDHVGRTGFASVDVLHAQTVLSACVALLGRLEIPNRRLGVVLRHASPEIIHLAETSLSFSIPLLRKWTPQLQRGLVIALFVGRGSVFDGTGERGSNSHRQEPREESVQPS